MSENVLLKTLGEKVNIPLFNEITSFILETANATLAQIHNLTRCCLLFDLHQENASIQEKYSFLYLGELLERYEERFGMPLPDLRAIALSLGFTSGLLTKEMFVGSQKKDFLEKVKEQADEDIYLTSALYLLEGDAERLEKEYTATEELLFVLGLLPDFEGGFQRFKPQLLRLVGKGRPMPILGNISMVRWFIRQIGPVIKAIRTKDVALFRALCSLQNSFVRPGSRQHDVLLENGYTPLEIAYMNMLVCAAAGHTLTAEKLAVQLFREVLPSEKPFSKEMYKQFAQMYIGEQNFTVKCYDTRRLIDALGKETKIGHADTFAWLAGLERPNHPIFDCFDVLDTRWDSLAHSLSAEAYEQRFSRSLDKGMDAEKIKANIPRYDKLASSNNVKKCCERKLCTFRLLVEKGIVDLWDLFCESVDGQVGVIENIGQYLREGFSLEVFRFYEKFFEKYGIEGLAQFFGSQHRWLFDSLVEKKYGYGGTYYTLTFYRPFLTTEEHNKLLNWLQEYYFQYETDNYTSFVKAVLLDKFAPGLLSAEEQRALFDLVISMKDLDPSEVRALKLRYLTPEEQQAERDAEIQVKMEKERQYEQERIQRIREEFAEKSSSFGDIHKYLEGYRYENANRRTACEIVAENMDALLKSRGYILAQKDIGDFLKVCGTMFSHQALDLIRAQNYIANIKEGLENDANKGND